MVRTPGRVVRAIVAATAVSLLVAGLFAAPVSAATATTTTITVTPSSPTIDDSITIRVSVTPAPSVEPYTCGLIELFDVTADPPVLLLEGGPCAPGGAWVERTWYPGTLLPVGVHSLKATFTPWEAANYQASESAVTPLTIGKVPTNAFVEGVWPWTPEVGESFQLRASVGHPYPGGGLYELWRVGAATPICSQELAVSIEIFCPVAALPAGTYQFKTVFYGDDVLAASVSPVLNITIGPNTVHTSGVGLQYTTFYPISDGYKDTVAIRGTRLETASVTARVYNSANTLLKTINIPSGNGSYSMTWNGRKATGTVRPEGKYRIVQTFTDSHGASRSITSYVNLSKKKIYTYTKTISKLGTNNKAQGGWPPNVVIYKNYTAGYLKLGIPSGTDGWAGAGYQFTLPTATLYKSFYVRIYGRHTGSVGVTQIGAQNFALGGCAYTSGTDWDLGCFASWANIPTTSGTTLHYYRTAGLASSFRSGTHVRLTVSTTGGTTWIYKAAVIVTYGILKY